MANQPPCQISSLNYYDYETYRYAILFYLFIFFYTGGPQCIFFFVKDGNGSQNRASFTTKTRTPGSSIVEWIGGLVRCVGGVVFHAAYNRAESSGMIVLARLLIETKIFKKSNNDNCKEWRMKRNWTVNHWNARIFHPLPRIPYPYESPLIADQWAWPIPGSSKPGIYGEFANSDLNLHWKKVKWWLFRKKRSNSQLQRRLNGTRPFYGTNSRFSYSFRYLHLPFFSWGQAFRAIVIGQMTVHPFSCSNTFHTRYR